MIEAGGAGLDGEFKAGRAGLNNIDTRLDNKEARHTRDSRKGK